MHYLYAESFEFCKFHSSNCIELTTWPLLQDYREVCTYSYAGLVLVCRCCNINAKSVDLAYFLVTLMVFVLLIITLHSNWLLNSLGQAQLASLN